jgi:N-dimethylarginine dimethylaminohydrolase
MTAYVLCCRPDYFKVVPGDNGYQEEGHAKWLENPTRWKERLLATWDAVATELARRGATVMQIPSQPDLPDQCFAADVVVFAMNRKRDNVFSSVMNSPVRQREVEYAINTLHAHGFSSDLGRSFPTDEHEGTGDFLNLHGYNIYVQGYGPRSKKGIGFLLSQVVNQMVVEVPLEITESHDGPGLSSKDTKGFHLDTLAMPLPDKRIIACFERMHPATRAFFETLYPPQRRIELTGAEADLFITNGLCVPKDFKNPMNNEWSLFLPDTTPKQILDKVAGWGFETILFDFEPSKLSGGALHCMFNFCLPINEANALPITEFGKPLGFDALPVNRQQALEPHRDGDQNDICYYSSRTARMQIPTRVA